MDWNYLGYLASFFLVVSMMMNDVVRLRYINLIGCICFTIYGAIIQAWPVAITNALLTVVNIIQLFKIHTNSHS